MEYEQITLNDWMEMKQKLRRELLGVKQSFVRIGFTLRQIEDQKLYEQDGYKSVAEFAKAEFGLEPSTTSRFMSINREYSIDGYSEILRPEYEELGRSQLEEMLKLPEDDRQMVQPETSRQDIRELKKFNKAGPETGVADDLRKVIENFFKENEGILNAVFSENNLGTDEENRKRLVEIINPGGNRSYRKGVFFLIMYEDKIAVKKFGASPQEMTWAEFLRITVEIFGNAAAGGKTWQRYFGEEKEESGDAEEDRGESMENEHGTGENARQDKTGETPETLNAEGIPQADNAAGKERQKAEEGTEEQQEAEEKEPEGKRETEKKRPEGQQAASYRTESPEKTEESEIAPAQKKPENTESEEDFEEAETERPSEQNTGKNEAVRQESDEIQGQMELTRDMPEYCPPFMNPPEAPEEEKEPPQEIAPAQKKPENTESGADLAEAEKEEALEEIKRPYGSRKAYLDKQTEYKAALYIAVAIKDMRHLTFSELTDPAHWEKWLKKEVDDNGEEIDIVG